MTIADILLIATGGFIGAIVRYMVSEKLNKREGFPVDTLLVNLVGSFFIGFIFGLELSLVWTVFLVSGFVGALTTYSTLNKELILLWQSERKQTFFVYLFITYAVGIILAYTGYYMGVLL